MLACRCACMQDIANAVSQRFPDLAGHDLVDVFVGFADLRFNPGAHVPFALSSITCRHVVWDVYASCDLQQRILVTGSQ